MAGASGRKGSSPRPRAPKGPLGSATSRMTDLDLFRDIQDGRDQIGAELVGQDVTVLDLEFLQQGIALGLHHRAFDLALHQGRVDGLADVVGRDHAQDTDMKPVSVSTSTSTAWAT